MLNVFFSLKVSLYKILLNKILCCHFNTELTLIDESLMIKLSKKKLIKKKFSNTILNKTYVSVDL